MLPYRNMTEPILDHTLSRLPHLADKVVLTCGSRSWTHTQLRDNANRFGNLLLAAGLRPGERMAIAMPDSLAWAAACLGAIRAGIIPVAVHAVFKRFQVEDILRHSDAAALVTLETVPSAGASASSLRTVLHVDDDRLEEFLAPHSPKLHPHQPTPEDVAFLTYTSGSTGHPKGVPHLHGDYASIYASFPELELRLGPEDLVFCPAKLSFIWGLVNNLFHVPTAGARCILITEPLTPPLVLEVMLREKPTVFLTVPTLTNALLPLLDENTHLENLRLCYSTGEPMPGPVAAAWQIKTGLPMHNCLGSSETSTCCVYGRVDPRRPEVSGTLNSFYEARVVNENGDDVPDGEPGVLLIRSPSLARFYWNDPEWSRRSMLEGGWWVSGDVVRREGDTFIFLGRNDDMLKIGGIWVSPAQVESVLLEHPGVRECAVTGVHMAGLMQVRAHVVPGEGLAPGPEAVGLLRRHMLERLPKYMCPSAVVFCDELPKTISGKIQRFKLRQEQTDDAA